MNKNIDDLKFGSSPEETLLEDFLLRSEPRQIDTTSLMGKAYAKIAMQKKRTRRRRTFLAAAVVLPLVFCALWMALLWPLGGPKGDGRVQMATHRAPMMLQAEVRPGDTMHITLPDGTRVMANSRTRISWPEALCGATRDVYIKGEAYFEVAHDGACPFVIHTGQFDVRVLGTKFCVDNYDEQAAKVVLVEGSVEVETRNNDRVRIRPNEKLRVCGGQFVSRESVSTADELCWLQGMIRLQGDELGRVAQRLEYYYGKKIVVDQRLQHQRLYGKLLIRNSVSTVLSNLCRIAGARVVADGHSVTLQGGEGA